MRNIFKVLIYLVFIALISCVRQTPDYPTIKLIPEELADFSDANVTALRVLEFENPENGFLGFIHKVEKYENKFYLINHTGESFEILMYNIDGSYAKRIGGIGRGPSEYISASDFAIDTSTGNLFVINHSNEVLKYSKNGEFLGEIQTGIISSSFELVNNELFYRYHGRSENYEIQVVSVSNSKGVIENILHETYYKSGQIAEINFFRDHENVYFREVFDNKIYQVNEENALPVIEFDFGDYNYNPEFSNMDIVSIYEEMVLKGSFLVFAKALIANEWIYAYFSNEKDNIGYHVLYNALTGQYQSFKTTESTGLLNAHLLDESGNMGFFVTGASLKELFNDEQLRLMGFTREAISDDSSWLLWLTV